MSDRQGGINPDLVQWRYSLSLALAISRRRRLELDLMGSRDEEQGPRSTTSIAFFITHLQQKNDG
jgi:hypothetical protein